VRFWNDEDIPELAGQPLEDKLTILRVARKQPEIRRKSIVLFLIGNVMLVFCMITGSVLGSFGSFGAVLNWVVFLSVVCVIAALRRVLIYQSLRTVVARMLKHAAVPQRWANCNECDYDLRGTPGWNCPECGTAIEFDPIDWEAAARV